MVGGQRIAQLFYASNLRYKTSMRVDLASINGQPAVLRYINDHLESAQAFETEGDRISRVLVQRNPDKLAGIASAMGAKLFASQ
jgi:RNA polymerase sigma-70 factor (ECF subfamily)